MKVFKILFRIANIVPLTITFLFLTLSILTQNSENGFWGYFSISSIIFYLFYIIFGFALLQYIRNVNLHWHNYYLSFIWGCIGWLSIFMTIVYPVFETFFSQESQSDMMIVVYQFIFNLTNGFQNNTEPNPYFFDFLISFIVMVHIFIVIGILFLLPIIFNVILFVGKLINQNRRKIFLVISSVSFIVVICIIIYWLFFGEMTQHSLEVYRTKVPQKDINLTFSQKIDNLEFAQIQVSVFLKTLFFNPIVIFIETLIFYLMSFLTVYRKFNSNNINLLLDEHN